ncbi:hypothetical protein I4U23_015857 [Adineta vaga]|nr:hypothetical protein I4U23_015857 [Adineta vaga]
MLKSSQDRNGYRILFIINATGSMSVFLNSLTVSLYQVASIMKLTTQFKSEISILYMDLVNSKTIIFLYAAAAAAAAPPHRPITKGASWTLEQEII